MKPINKNQRVLLAFLGIASLASLLATGCRRDENRALNVVGSTSIQPFAELLAQAYDKQNPGKQVDVQGGGSTAGLQAAANGLADIGMCSRALTDEEAKQFTAVVIARDGVAVIVNNANPVNGLKTEQIRDIFSGKIKNWKEVGGKDDAIRAITREEGSGTRESFVHLVMGKEKIAREALAQESNGAVKELVKGDPAAIAYISLGLVDKQIKAVNVDEAEATPENVLSGK